MIRLTAAAAVLALGACTMQDSPDTAPPASGQCNAAAAQALVGQPGEASRSRAMELSGAATVRVYRQGQPITMDYREDRVNLVTDSAGAIIEVKCG